MFFLSLLTGINLPLAISKKKKLFFFGKRICFCKQPEFCTFWETLLLQVHFAAFLLPFRIFEIKKSGFFFLENPTNCQKNQVLNVSRTSTVSVVFHGKFPNFSDFWKCRTLLEIPTYFFEKKPNLNVLKNFIRSFAVYVKLDTVSD